MKGIRIVERFSDFPKGRDIDFAVGVITPDAVTSRFSICVLARLVDGSFAAHIGYSEMWDLQRRFEDMRYRPSDQSLAIITSYDLGLEMGYALFRAEDRDLRSKEVRLLMHRMRQAATEAWEASEDQDTRQRIKEMQPPLRFLCDFAYESVKFFRKEA